LLLFQLLVEFFQAFIHLVKTHPMTPPIMVMLPPTPEAPRAIVTL
jgi:hypothetical protein